MSYLLISDNKYPNDRLKKRIKEEVNRRGSKIAYISSDHQTNLGSWFKNTVKEYKVIDPKIRIDYFDLSQDFSEIELGELNKYGTILLSGGSAYKFITYIRDRNLKRILESINEKKGLIIGVCAGGIVLTPTIKIVEVGERYVKDKTRIKNYIIANNFNDYSGLNLVPFEFYPHYYEEFKENEDLKRYAEFNKTIVYACKVEDGIFIEGDKIETIGDVRKFSF